MDIQTLITETIRFDYHPMGYPEREDQRVKRNPVGFVRNENSAIKGAKRCRSFYDAAIKLGHLK